MPLIDPPFWSEKLTQTLQRYDESLLRQVAAQLVRPRGQWPAQELIHRCLTITENAAVIDRRLVDLSTASRQILALIGRSRQPRWHVGHLVELLICLGQADGLAPVMSLLEGGLLFPDLATVGERFKLRTFSTWLAQGDATALYVFAHPAVTARALGGDLGLPDLSQPWGDLPALTPAGSPAWREADGLEWLLRMAVLWQQVRAGPLRRTQQGGLFKRDLERLRGQPLLSSEPAGAILSLRDPALLALELARVEGLVCVNDHIQVGKFPAAWEEGLPAALASLWAGLPQVCAWNPIEGWQAAAPTGAYPTLYLLALLLVARGNPEQVVPVNAVAEWIANRHPCWKRTDGAAASVAVTAVTHFLLGLSQQLGLLRAARDPAGEWHVQMTGLGHWVLASADRPACPNYPQTLLVQPNLEILVYRQGLTPGLLQQLSRFATWKTLGSACTAQLEPETVYAGLQGGATFESILQTLERHGMKPTPPPVIESLRTWANKHERITIYPSATLFEFLTPEDLNEALARGLPAQRLTDRLAVAASEKDIDFSHFRLTGTRDYHQPAERCVIVETDGVTLSIDLARSDLLLEPELRRLAELVSGSPGADASGLGGRRQYRLTPASLASARHQGMSLAALEAWFLQRTGQPLSPAARLLFTGSSLAPLTGRSLLVIQVPDVETADGLLQWSGTRGLLVERLGPTALVVARDHLGLLRERLGQIGMSVRLEEGN